MTPKERETKIVEETADRMFPVPATGMFGQLDVQLKSLLSEAIIDRMDAMNELVEVEKETTRIMREEWLPVAKRRQDQMKALAVSQGFAPKDNGEPAEK